MLHPPILLYHKVSPDWEVGITVVTPANFERQIYHLKELGWNTVLPDADGQESGTGESLGGKTFILVFDDAYECVFSNALPILSECGFTAVVFVPTAYIDKWNEWDHHLLGRRFRHMSRAQIEELMKRGWMIGSHTVSHNSLIGMTEHELERELGESKSMLEDWSGKEINWVSFPFGRYDNSVVSAAHSAGYSGAIVPSIRHVSVPQGFSLMPADAVYRWDTATGLTYRLSRPGGFTRGRILRRSANWLSGGTILWKKLFRD